MSNITDTLPIILGQLKENEERKEYIEEIKEYDYPHKKGEKHTLKDAKIFIQEKSNNDETFPICLCFLSIYEKENGNDNPKKCPYDDKTELDDTNFSKGKKMYICISKDISKDSNCLMWRT